MECISLLDYGDKKEKNDSNENKNKQTTIGNAILARNTNQTKVIIASIVGRFKERKTHLHIFSVKKMINNKKSRTVSMIMNSLKRLVGG